MIPRSDDESLKIAGGPEVVVASDPFAVAADRIVALLDDAIRARGNACLALSGGRTPLPLFKALVFGPRREHVQWHRVELFWIDERAVPPEHPDSNFGDAKRALIEPLAFAAGRVHRMRGELPIDEAAKLYEEELRRLAPAGLDLALIGIGADGHIASLFPGSPALAERRALAAAVLGPDGRPRITLTPPALALARSILVLACGAEKAGAVARALDPRAPESPARLAACSRAFWVLDQAAAALLPRPG